MADTKLSALTAATTVGSTDELYLNDSGTSKRITMSNFEGAITGANITGWAVGDLLADGTVPLTANWDVGAYTITCTQLISDIVTGTAPFVVASTTVCTSLNADQVDGNDASDLLARANHTGSQLAATVSDFETAVAAGASTTANTAKVTNATHTGEVTGSTALTVDPSAISGQSLVTVAATDSLLILDDSDSPNALKKIVASDFATSGHSHTAPEGTAVLSTGEVGGSKFLREDGDNSCSWQTIAGGGDALVANPLSQFAATTSLQLKGVISDETGSGALCFATSPTLVTPALGTPASGVMTNVSGTAASLTAGAVSTITGLAPDTATTAAAQPNITSLGTLTTLTVDDITVNGNTISSAGASTLAITPTAGQSITFDGTITLDAGVIAGATSITSTAFVGALTGNADTTTTNANLTGPVTSVGNATAIADKALAIAKLADGTDGELITWDASGVIAAVPVGSSGEVLTSGGVGVAPTFQAAAGGSGAFSADGDTQITPTTPIVLDQATGNEIALDLQYTTNKASSGNDTGLLVNQTDTASPGTSLLADFQVGGTSQLKVDNTGKVITLGGQVESAIADGAGSNAFVFDMQNTFSTSGANLFQIQNGSTAVFDLSYQGGIDHVNSGASTAAHSQSMNMNWASTGTKTSSGQFSSVLGYHNTASGSRSCAVGDSNTAGGQGSFVAGDNCTVAGLSSGAIGSLGNISGSYSVGFGRYGNTTNRATIALGAGSSGLQSLTTAAYAATTGATQTTLKAVATDVDIPADTTWGFSALVVARSDESAGNESMFWRLEGLLSRDESGNTALVGSVTKTIVATNVSASPQWDVVAEADDANDALAIKGTGIAATNIKWSARVDMASVLYA